MSYVKSQDFSKNPSSVNYGHDESVVSQKNIGNCDQKIDRMF